MSVPDISIVSMGILFLLLLIPIGVSTWLKLGFVKTMIFAVVRMSLQLVFAGFYLIILFDLANPILNIFWFIGMIFIATATTIRHSNLPIKQFFIPSFIALGISIGFVLFCLNGFVIRVDELFSAKYLIVLGGMLIGNSTRGIIIGINDFYTKIARDKSQYEFSLATGASFWEAILPYFRESMKTAINPTIATMMTLGLVWLPGMMTGQILGGSDPMVAIKYQIAIMVAIFAVTTMSVLMTILLSLQVSFDGFGNFKYGKR